MSWARDLVSSRSGRRLGLHEQPPTVGDEVPWLVTYDLDPSKGAALKDRLARRPWSLWRYEELLPVQNFEYRIDLGEGGTPLVRVRRALRHQTVWLKEEAGNPTGSFKDRGLSLAVNRARELGAPGVQLPSAGNAALATAAYAAAGGLRCRVALPSDTPSLIVDRCRSYGAEVHRGGATLVDSAAELAGFSDGYWDLSTFREPYRVEGKKTMGLELVEQFEWQPPDWIFYPTGGGTGIVAMFKAFQELQMLGLLQERLPRLAAVQMEGCAPLVRAFESGGERAETWENPQTRVWGLRVPRSLADSLILEALRSTKGTAVSVAEEELAEVQSRFARQEGRWLGPEGAAAVAGFEALYDAGRIGEGERVVIFQTGHPANYLEPKDTDQRS
jgi:threonine synthase